MTKEESADLRHRMKAHYEEIKCYRGEAMFHATLGATQPERYISIAQDAVDATDRGIPVTLEKTVAEDGYKLKSKTMVTMVHGSSINYYVMPENVHAGPNSSIEALHRTLHKEKEARGSLPPIMYLQADNSWREVKNTYFICYLAWLVTKKIFTTIYLCFHPKGHTHNECDQCGSRIVVALHGAKVLCKCMLERILRASYCPAPDVEWMNIVMDWKRQVNPTYETNPEFSLHKGSRVERGFGMTRAQLFKIEWHGPPRGRWPDRQVCVMDKLSVLTPAWSEPYFPWNTDPDNIELSDVKGPIFRPVPAARLEAIAKTLETYHYRQNAHQIAWT